MKREEVAAFYRDLDAYAGKTVTVSGRAFQYRVFVGFLLTSSGRYAIYLMNICLQKELNFMDSEVFARIRDYLADQLEVDPEKITPESDIVNDFGADSLDVIDMITTLSDEFNVEIPDEEIENFHTVGDVVNYLEERL